MTVTNLIYKENDILYRTSITYPLGEWIENNPTTEYFVLTNNSFDDFTDCLILENGVLSYDLTLLKETINVIRKNILLPRFAPYDKVFEDIEARKVPESYFEDGYVVAKQNAEAQRVIIRADLETYKQQINNATTAEEVLEIWQDIINS